MVPSSKFFLSMRYLLIVLTLYSCDICCEDDVVDASSPNNKLLILVDQSKSVSYAKNNAFVTTKLKEMFRMTYRNVTGKTEYCLAYIGTDKGVVPESLEFKEPYPDKEALGGSSFDMQLMNWQMEKDKWITSAISRVQNGLESHSDKDTDIFTAIECVNTATTSGEKMEKGDTLHMIIFSDMDHSMPGYDFKNLLNENTAVETLAKTKFTELQNQHQITSINNDIHHSITIIGPDVFNNTPLIKRYWNAFFKEWGFEGNIDWRKTQVE